MMETNARRYDTQVDLSAKNTSHAQLILLTGRNKRVLEIGPATGYMTEVLRSCGCRITAIEKDPIAAEIAARFCERIIVGDVEGIDLADMFRNEKFDVVMFGDVLEHLIDPKGVLERVGPLLNDGGYIVASIPNVAHASVRLMLLDGKFTYTDKGLLDYTHLRFFTKQGIQALFQEAGYAVTTWRRTLTDTLQDPLAEDHSPSESDLPPYLLEALRRDPEASTYQFVVRAYPRKSASSRSRRVAPTVLSDGAESVVKDLRQMGELLVRKDQEIEQLQDTVRARDIALAERDRSIADVELALHTTRAQLTFVTGSIGYRLLERVRRLIRRLAPGGSRRLRALALLKRGLHIILTEGWRAFFVRSIRVRRWLPRLTADPAQLIRTRDDQYQQWLRMHALTSAQIRRIRRKAARLQYRPLISIIMPVYNPELTWLRDAIESVRGQLYDDWELCVADDASTRSGVRELLEEYSRMDPRIKVTYLEQNRGIAGASNAALGLADGEFVGLLDHDDELKSDALFEVVNLLNERRDLDYIYSDEDKKDSDGRLTDPFFKPDWSPDLHMSINYVTHFSVFRKALVDQVGGFGLGYDGSQDYELVLRITERTNKVAHIAKPLYTWRKSPGSAASSVDAKAFAYAAAKKALQDTLERRGFRGTVEDGLWAGSYRVRYWIAGNPKVSIIVPTRDRVDMLRRCVDSIKEKSSYTNYEILVVDNDSRDRATLQYLSSLDGRVIHYPGEFNFARIINTAAREATGEFLIPLNNDTEVISEEWIEAMLEHGQRPEVAAVGARLFYPDGRVQHEGIIMGLGTGSAMNVDHGGYFGLGELIHNCTAVTGACMLTRTAVFWELGGFDERLRVAFNDVDFCLRAREKGYRIVYTPFATLIHHESATRGRLHPDEDEKFFRTRWGNPGEYRDPYYNPNLDPRRPFQLRVPQAPALD